MSVGAVIIVGIIRFVGFIYTWLTIPIYWIVQQPWKVKKLSNELKAKPTSKDNDQITYQSVRPTRSLHQRLNKEGIYTLEQVLRFGVQNYRNKRCLGTREILAEEDERQADGKMFKKYRMGNYKWRSFDDVETEATNFGKGMRELGMSVGEKVVIFAETRAEWMIAAHGLFKQNVTVCTIYATLGEDGIAFGVNETEVKYVITSHELVPKVKNIMKDCPNVHTVIYFEDQLNPTDTTGFGETTTVVPYKSVVRLGANNRFDQHPPTRDDIAILMYTSGSTGTPKGVQLSHGNCLATLRGFSDGVDVRDTDVFLGVLPLAHVYELLAESASMVVGVGIGYSTPLTLLDTSAKIMTGTLGDSRVLMPTVMTAVPLILDRVRKGITDKMSKESPIKRELFNYCLKYKARWVRRGFRTPIVDAVVFKKVAALLGGRMRAMISGGAPLSPDTHQMIRNALCLDVVQGYGLTETTAAATVMEQTDRTTGRSGAPSTTTSIRLVNWEEGNYKITNKPFPQGEILVGGDNVAMGYYKRPDLTDESFFIENGRRWFRTGDIGEFHEDGGLKIIDRKKDLVKLQHGEYISLGKVESELKTCQLIEFVCVYADSTKTFCVALVAPAEIGLKTLADSLGISGDFDQLVINQQMQKEILKAIVDHSKKCNLAKFEIPTQYTIVKEQWTPESGLVTAAFKIKRKDILDKYKEDITRMYS